MTEIRTLTVRQPWAWAIIHGGKDVENRSRNIAGAYRGPVLIHAAKLPATHVEVSQAMSDAMNRSGRRHVGEGYWWDSDHEDQMCSSAFIGVVDLVGVHFGMDNRHGGVHCVDHKGRTQYFSGVCSPWGERNSHHLVLIRPRPLPKPIPYKGRLGLWRIDTDQVPGLEELL